MEKALFLSKLSKAKGGLVCGLQLADDSAPTCSHLLSPASCNPQAGLELNALFIEIY